jgi:hypothetical protein
MKKLKNIKAQKKMAQYPFPVIVKHSFSNSPTSGSFNSASHTIWCWLVHSECLKIIINLKNFFLW